MLCSGDLSVYYFLLELCEFGDRIKSVSYFYLAFEIFVSYIPYTVFVNFLYLKNSIFILYSEIINRSVKCVPFKFPFRDCKSLCCFLCK